MHTSIIGWDIGGAHLKAAQIDLQGNVLQVTLQPCPLWLGLGQLTSAVQRVLALFAHEQARHVITMTGELVDLFDNREEGVAQILTTMQRLLVSEPLVFAGQQGFLPLTRVLPPDYSVIASANWLASALFVAQQLEQGVFIDIGSTTTDILRFRQQQVLAQGYTDYERLRSGELLYTGIIRTAVMAVAQQAEFNGQQQGLMAEYFATMADVYRLSGELPEQHDHTETADGGDKSVEASARRLSRMTGYDFRSEDLALWQQFALELRQQQLQLIRQQLNRLLTPTGFSTSTYLVGAGIGRFLVRALAEQLGMRYVDFSALLLGASEAEISQGSDCAPAVAVAALSREIAS